MLLLGFVVCLLLRQGLMYPSPQIFIFPNGIYTRVRGHVRVTAHAWRSGDNWQELFLFLPRGSHIANSLLLVCNAWHTWRGEASFWNLIFYLDHEVLRLKLGSLGLEAGAGKSPSQSYIHSSPHTLQIKYKNLEMSFAWGPASVIPSLRGGEDRWSEVRTVFGNMNWMLMSYLRLSQTNRQKQTACQTWSQMCGRWYKVS